MDIKPHLRAAYDRCLTAPVVFDYYGLERGGHHAVLNWILAGGPHPASYLTLCHTPEPRLRRNHPNGFLTPDVQWPQVVALTYDRDSVIVKGDRPCIVCVRDVRNVLASRLRWQELGRSQMPTDAALIARWTQYAQHAIDHPQESIVYDRWFDTLAYRATTAARLAVLFDTPWMSDDPAVREVSRVGHGSSFDHLEYSGRAHEMQVLDRWRAYANHPVYKSLITPAVLELNRRLLNGLTETQRPA